MKRLKTTRKIAAIALLALGSTTAFGQVDSKLNKSIYGELGGASNGIGVNYDARFKEGSQWGYRVGFGFGYSKTSFLFGVGTSTRVYSVPLEINYLAGKKKSRFEVGAGVNVGLYNDHFIGFEIVPDEEHHGYNVRLTPYISENSVSAVAFVNIGYRYTSTRGFQFRVGITPCYQLTPNRDVVNRFGLAPYISFGKAF
ncbi:hypothetical protein [Prevotella sp. HUN102]|uniref:hypothetical protein n=1 Tax=Prevotella sp. HUN102 TaxID=1392486 RepID=UPI000691A86E|nr:hypothetical protein [Prevotella sp. HUN102]